MFKLEKMVHKCHLFFVSTKPDWSGYSVKVEGLTVNLELTKTKYISI